MKNEDVKIGMKVVPFRKTVWDGLDGSYEWEKAVHAHQPFLYVTDWDDDEGCWCLSHENVPNTFSADFFNAEDFHPYTDDDWIDTASEPSPTELAAMNASAEELRLQFE